MPTSETRTHASITIPLSSTRSRTSMRLLPPVVRSTGIVGSPRERSSSPHLGPPGSCARLAGQRGDASLQAPDLLLQRSVLDGEPVSTRGQVGVVSPPVQADLLGLVDGA